MQSTSLEQPRCLAPGRQRHRVHGGARLFGDHRQVLAQIHARAQLVDGLLPGARRGRIGGGQEPARQGIFANVGAGCGQELEQGSRPEQVEIPGVRMGWVQVTVAGLPGAGPFAIQARQRSFKEPLGTTAALEQAQQVVVDHYQEGENGDGDSDPEYG